MLLQSGGEGSDQDPTLSRVEAHALSSLEVASLSLWDLLHQTKKGIPFLTSEKCQRQFLSMEGWCCGQACGQLSVKVSISHPKLRKAVGDGLRPWDGKNISRALQGAGLDAHGVGSRGPGGCACRSVGCVMEQAVPGTIFLGSHKQS